MEAGLVVERDVESLGLLGGGHPQSHRGVQRLRQNER